MKIHLIRSPEVDEEFFAKIVEIIEKYPGPVNFISGASEVYFTDDEIVNKKFNKDKFKRQAEEFSIFESKAMSSMPADSWPPEYPDVLKMVSWNSIFDKCNHYRKSNNIPDEEQVFLLTDFPNDKNWFTAGDPSGKKNSFIHTGQWEFFLPCDPRFPVAYEVMVTFFQGQLFKNYEEALSKMHKKPRGCVNDFCADKKDITLKLRTADICTDCQKLLHDREIDRRIIDQVLRTIDDIRAQMLFRERYKTTLQPSRLDIRGPLKRIFFTDLSNTELKLTPLERTVYLLFLDHPGGLRLSEISDHKKWIEETYKEIGNSRTVAEFRNSIEQLVDPTENSLNEKLSRIRRKIISLAGDDLAIHYIIDGARDEKKKINLDRKLVRMDEGWRESD